MDIDFLKSISNEDHMEMVSMMMDINYFCGQNNYSESETPTMDLCGVTNSGSSDQFNSTKSFLNDSSQQIIENPHVGLPTFVNLPSTISFSGEPPTGAEMPFSPNSGMRKQNSMAAMREMIFRIAAMQPIHIDPESVKPPKRRNVKISKDPQSVAARHRRERISERIRILQRLVPGGTKMDTASMLDEAIHYVKFLKTQVQSLERAAANRPPGIGFPVAAVDGSYMPHLVKGYQLPAENVDQYSDA